MISIKGTGTDVLTINHEDVDENFELYRTNGDSAVYHGADASDVNIHSLTLSSVPPKRGNNQFGNRRSELKLTRSTTVKDLEGRDVVRTRKIATQISIPVGTDERELNDDLCAMGLLLMKTGMANKLAFGGDTSH